MTPTRIPANAPAREVVRLEGVCRDIDAQLVELVTRKTEHQLAISALERVAHWDGPTPTIPIPEPESGPDGEPEPDSPDETQDPEQDPAPSADEEE